MVESSGPGLFTPPRRRWLESYSEEAIYPDIPIVDAHHHLWDRPGSVYLAKDLADDFNSGHRILASVFVECRSMYRADGPEHLRPVGEVEFADQVAEQSARGDVAHGGLCAGIVGHADLTLGDAVQEVLEAAQTASRRFRGVRHRSAWHSDGAFHRPATYCPPGLLLDPTFRAGFARLAPAGLTFDAFLFFTQLDDLASLAHAFPTTGIVLDHLGMPVGVGVYGDRLHEVFRLWREGIRAVAACENVTVKLGGLGMTSAGFKFHERALPPGSAELAEAWRPYIETAIEAFGPHRSMFESNFPPDKSSCSYPVLWNAFKRLTEGRPKDEVSDLFAGTAIRVYQLDIQDG